MDLWGTVGGAVGEAVGRAVQPVGLWAGLRGLWEELWVKLWAGLWAELRGSGQGSGGGCGVRLWDTALSRASGAPRNIQGEGIRGVGRAGGGERGQAGQPSLLPKAPNKFLKFKNCFH